MVGCDILLFQRSGNIFGTLEEVERDVFGVSGQASGYYRRPTGEAVDLLPALWRLCQHSQHVMAANAVGASDDGRQPVDVLWIDWEAMEDAL